MNAWTVSAVEALRMGAEALRADADSQDGLGTLGDPEGAARDRAAARALDSIAEVSRDPFQAIDVAERLRHVADAYMGCDTRFRLLCEAESIVRRALGVASEPVAIPEPGDEFPEDRVSRLGVRADPRDLAASLLGAIQGERLEIAAIACGILAKAIVANPASIDDDDRRALVEAIRRDWTMPDR